MGLFVSAKGHGWCNFGRSTEDATAFADWFDRYLKSHGAKGGVAQLRQQAGSEARTLEANKHGFPAFNDRHTITVEAAADC